MRPISSDLKLGAIKRVQEGEKVARVCREVGISRKTFYVWSRKYSKSRPSHAYRALRDRRFKTKLIYKLLHPKDKLLIISKATYKEDNVASLCRHYGISRKTFYFWLKRYRSLGEKGLVWQRLTGESHPRAVSVDVRQAVLAFVAKYPHLSVHRVSAELDFIGHHGIQNIFAKEDLNTIAKRQLFALGYLEEPNAPIAPLYRPQIPLYKLRQILAPFAT